MTPVRNFIWPGLAGLIVVSILGAAAVLPLMARVEPGTSPAQVAEVIEDDCWGCVPFRRMIQLFEFQRTAAIPHVAVLERRASQRNMLPGAEALLAELDLAREQLTSAEQALEVLIIQRDDCSSNEACRLGPEVFQQQTCSEDWPNAQLHNSLTRIADQAFSLGSRCRGMSCPIVSCTARARLDGTFEVLLDALVELQERPEVLPQTSQSYFDYLGELTRHLELLPLMLTDGSDVRIEEWRAGLDAFVHYAGEEENEVEGPPVWRQRLLTRYLEQLKDFAAQSFDGLPPESRGWWPTLVETTALALVQVHYLEWQPGTDLATCQAPRSDRLETLTASLRRASAALAVCGARGGCAPSDPVHLLEQFDARQAGNVSSASDFLNAARTVLAAELGELTLSESEPVDLVMELNAYGAGEAIGVELGTSTNTCVAEDGAWLGLFAQGEPGGSGIIVSTRALGRLPLNRRTRQGMAFLEAPTIAGDYEIRAFAPDARGGAELAREPLIVWPGPTSCEGFDGVWDTDFGELRIFVRGNDVRGTYRRGQAAAPGYFTGELQGRVLYGHWSSELGGGGARLVLAADGQRFRGTWSDREGQFAGIGQWNGTCIASQIDQIDRD